MSYPFHELLTMNWFVCWLVLLRVTLRYTSDACCLATSFSWRADGVWCSGLATMMALHAVVSQHSLLAVAVFELLLLFLPRCRRYLFVHCDNGFFFDRCRCWLALCGATLWLNIVRHLRFVCAFYNAFGVLMNTLWLSNNTWRWANVRSIAAYRRTQRSSLQLGLRVGGHLALTDFGPEEPQWTLAYG